MPGPGTYFETDVLNIAQRSLNNQIKNEPIAKFGRAKKLDVLEVTMARNYTVPASNTYSPNMGFTQNVILPRGAHTAIGKQNVDIITQRWGLRENQEKPGPGMYEVEGGFD